MKKIVFLGSKPIGYICLDYLIKNQKTLNIEIIGILTNDNLRFGKEYNLKSLAKENEIDIIDSLNDLLKIEGIDILISIQYHEILKKEHIAKAKEIAINLHMAPLPEYRGCNQFSFAIYNDENEFGTTIHRLEEGVDNGSIIFESRFKIRNDIAILELYQKTFDESVSLFKNNIQKIFDGDYSLKPQKDYDGVRKQNFYFRKDIKDLKQIDINDSEDVVDRIIRATSMPGYEPPYTYVKGKKVYILTEESYRKLND